MTTENQPTRWLTIKQFVAVNPLSESTVRRLIRRNLISHSQLGGPGTTLLVAADALSQTNAPAPSECELPSTTDTTLPKSGPTPAWKKAKNKNQGDRK